MSRTRTRLRDSLEHRWAEDRLSPYVSDDLRPRARRRLARHARRCPECRRALRQLRALIRALRDQGSTRRAGRPVGERTAARVRRRIDELDRTAD